MFNQTWEETLLVKESILESVKERQLRKVSLFLLVVAELHCLEEGAKKSPKVTDDGQRYSLEWTGQLLISFRKTNDGDRLCERTLSDVSLPAEGDFERVAASEKPLEGVLTRRPKCESEYSQDSEKKFHLWTSSRQERNMKEVRTHHRLIKDRQSRMKSQKSRNAYFWHDGLFRTEGHVSTKANSLCKINSVASLHVMGLSFPNKREENNSSVTQIPGYSKPPTVFWSQTRKLKLTPKSLALFFWLFGGQFTVSSIVEKTRQRTWLLFFAVVGRTAQISGRKKSHRM